MPFYKCEYCNYESNLLGNYKRHINSKKHHHNINNITNNIAILGVKSQNEPKMSQYDPKMSRLMSQNEPQNSQNHQNVFKCNYCGENFKTKANKRRHELHRCKENPAIIERLLLSKDEKIKSLELEKDNWKKEKDNWEKEKEKLYVKIDQLISKVGHTNNIQNNIIINNYGEEDLSHITDKIKTELLKIPYGAIPKLIESVHFNDEKPENKNILMPNKKENMLKVYHGDKWIYKNKNETIRDLIDSKYIIIDNHYDQIKNNVSNKIENSYSKFRKIYDEGDEELINSLKKECDLVLLNHRE